MTWDSSFEATPAGSDQRRDGDDRIRELKTEIRTKADVEVNWGSSGSSRNRKGSARVFVQTTAPTALADGATDTASPSASTLDGGRVWYETDAGYTGYVYEDALPSGSAEWRPQHVLGASGWRNALDNGSFRWWRRMGTTVTVADVTAGARNFVCDRWYVDPAGAVPSAITRTAATTVTNAASRYAIKITGETSVTTVDLGQRISADRVSYYLDRPVVFHFRILNSTGAALTPKVVIKSTNTADNFASANLTTRVSATDMKDASTGATAAIADASSAWVYYTTTLSTGSVADYRNGLQVSVQIPDTFLSANTKSVTITDAMLEIGNFPRPYEARPPAADLAECEHYYTKSYNETTSAAATTYAGALHWPSLAGSSIATPVPFKAEMRTTPTVTFFSPATGTSGVVRSSGDAADYAVSSTISGNDTRGTNGCSVASTASPATAGYLSIHFIADAEFTG